MNSEQSRDERSELEIAEAALKFLGYIAAHAESIGQDYDYRRVRRDEAGDVICEARDAADNIAELLGDLRALLGVEGLE